MAARDGSKSELKHELSSLVIKIQKTVSSFIYCGIGLVLFVGIKKSWDLWIKGNVIDGNFIYERRFFIDFMDVLGSHMLSLII